MSSLHLKTLATKNKYIPFILKYKYLILINSQNSQVVKILGICFRGRLHGKISAWAEFTHAFMNLQPGLTLFKNCLLSHHVCDVMCWVKWSDLELSCGRTVYCCCLIAISTAWEKFMKISYWKYYKYKKGL